MSEPIPDDERARKLEEARKKVEELKKKKNKKKNKSKKKELTTDVEEEAPETPDNLDENDATADVLVEDQVNKADDISSDQVLELENPGSVDADQIEGSAEETKKEESTATGVDEFEDKDEKKVGVEGEDENENKEVAVETKTNEAGDDLFADEVGADDFMTTIQAKKEEQAIETMRQEIQDLKEQLKKLKFVNMEQETMIEELEEEVGALKSQVSSKEDEIKGVRSQLSEMDVELTTLREHISESKQSLEFSSFQKHSPVAQVASPATTSLDPAVLQKWKNWNVDMSSWRSIGIGPVVQL